MNETANTTIATTDTATAVTVATVTIPATQSRWRSTTMWVAVAAAVWTMLSATGLIQKFGLSDSGYNTVISSVTTILTLIGVLNNPTDPVKY